MESKIIRIAAIKCTLVHVQLLFGQYVFIVKSVNEATYCDCNTGRDYKVQHSVCTISVPLSTK